MKRKIICLLLAIVMVIGACAALSSCKQGGDEECTKCVDTKPKDGKCDVCGKTVKAKCNHVDEDPKDDKCDLCGNAMASAAVEYPWADDDEIPLVFQMSKNSNRQNLPSGCMRYLAGEDTKFDAKIDKMIADRNADAYYETNVKVTYKYYDDEDERYGWGKCISEMYDTIYTNAPGSPDMYCNFQYDLVGTYLKSMFANLKSTKYTGENYFEFTNPDYNELVDNRGYMYDYMESTTLDKSKMYILASDYFLDLIRAFFVVPVNIRLLESVGMDITGDIDDKVGFTIDDFYTQVKNRKWTYDLAAKYSAAVYKKGDKNPGTGTSIHDTLGFAIGNSGLHGTGMLYTTEIEIIEEKINPDTGEKTYYYPENCEPLYDLAKALNDFFSKPGVLLVNKDYTGYGQDGALAIRTRFCQDQVLFGSTIMIGSLEYDDYQKLKTTEGSGFGVVPVPLYHEIEEGSDETYLTTIHNIGRPGAIAYNTKYFTQCTAFLNYQSTHSTDILNFYYDYQLQYDIADGSKGTVEMLQYIRHNVRSAFDKTFEDALGIYDSNTSNRWHSVLTSAGFKVADMRGEYNKRIAYKQKLLANLYKDFPRFPA